MNLEIDRSSTPRNDVPKETAVRFTEEKDLPRAAENATPKENEYLTHTVQLLEDYAHRVYDEILRKRHSPTGTGGYSAAALLFDPAFDNFFVGETCATKMATLLADATPNEHRLVFAALDETDRRRARAHQALIGQQAKKSEFDLDLALEKVEPIVDFYLSKKQPREDHLIKGKEYAPNAMIGLGLRPNTRDEILVTTHLVYHASFAVMLSGSREAASTFFEADKNVLKVLDEQPDDRQKMIAFDGHLVSLEAHGERTIENAIFKHMHASLKRKNLWNSEDPAELRQHFSELANDLEPFHDAHVVNVKFTISERIRALEQVWKLVAEECKTNDDYNNSPKKEFWMPTLAKDAFHGVPLPEGTIIRPALVAIPFAGDDGRTGGYIKPVSSSGSAVAEQPGKEGCMIEFHDAGSLKYAVTKRNKPPLTHTESVNDVHVFNSDQKKEAVEYWDGPEIQEAIFQKNKVAASTALVLRESVASSSTPIQLEQPAPQPVMSQIPRREAEQALETHTISPAQDRGERRGYAAQIKEFIAGCFSSDCFRRTPSGDQDAAESIPLLQLQEKNEQSGEENGKAVLYNKASPYDQIMYQSIKYRKKDRENQNWELVKTGEFFGTSQRVADGYRYFDCGESVVAFPFAEDPCKNRTGLSNEVLFMKVRDSKLVSVLVVDRVADQDLTTFAKLILRNKDGLKELKKDGLKPLSDNRRSGNEVLGSLIAIGKFMGPLNIENNPREFANTLIAAYLQGGKKDRKDRKNFWNDMKVILDGTTLKIDSLKPEIRYSLSEDDGWRRYDPSFVRSQSTSFASGNAMRGFTPSIGVCRISKTENIPPAEKTGVWASTTGPGAGSSQAAIQQSHQNQPDVTMRGISEVDTPALDIRASNEQIPRARTAPDEQGPSPFLQFHILKAGQVSKGAMAQDIQRRR